MLTESEIKKLCHENEKQIKNVSNWEFLSKWDFVCVWENTFYVILEKSVYVIYLAVVTLTLNLYLANLKRLGFKAAEGMRLEQLLWSISSQYDLFLPLLWFFSPWADMKGLIWKGSPNVSISINRAWGHADSLSVRVVQEVCTCWKSAAFVRMGTHVHVVRTCSSGVKCSHTSGVKWEDRPSLFPLPWVHGCLQISPMDCFKRLSKTRQRAQIPLSSARIFI